MKKSLLFFFAVPALVLLLLLGLFSWQSPSPTPLLPAKGNARTVLAAYQNWSEGYEAQGAERSFGVGLGWMRGISTERTDAHGQVSFDLMRGLLSAEVKGLPEGRAADLWLVDNRPAPGHSFLPEPHDVLLPAGRLQVEDGVGRLSASLGPEVFRDFDIDLVVVTYAGQSPMSGGVLFGTPHLFQRLHRQAWRSQQGWEAVAGEVPEKRPFWAFAQPLPAQAIPSGETTALLFDLVADGAELFTNETFDGNGRTCATCHPVLNNFTLDSTYIASLPADDPLFVAEFNDSLNSETNGGRIFEKPSLMRRFGLIAINIDGFDDLENRYVMRSPNHLFALALSRTPAFNGNDRATIPPEDRLGWSGDGAIGSGTLREFATGAVFQHFTKTLTRRRGPDYRLPTDEELDAIEAYLLSLGRPLDFSLKTMAFKNADVVAGQTMYLKPTDDGVGLPAAKCERCHGNGGANLENLAIGTFENWNFDIGVRLLSHPAEELGEYLPSDGGFGIQTADGVIFGNNTFNTPSIVEAAETAPYFHNNMFPTLEEAITFYTSDEFNFESFAGSTIRRQNNGIPIQLDETQVNQIGALLRVLGALDNIRAVEECHFLIKPLRDVNLQHALLPFCIADNKDAVDVLTGSPLNPHPVAVDSLSASLSYYEAALASSDGRQIQSLLSLAAKALTAAEADMIETSSRPIARRGTRPGVRPQAGKTVTDLPKDFVVFPNYPNPFNPETEIRFQIPTAGMVTVQVFDTQGRLVRTLAAGHHEAGLYQVRWDSRDQSGTSVASGTYLYRIQVGASAQVGQMTLLK